MRPRPCCEIRRDKQDGNSESLRGRSTAEKNVVVQSALYRVELSNRGGVVQSWKLNKYFDDQKPPHPLDLVNPTAWRSSSAGRFHWCFRIRSSKPGESDSSEETHAIPVQLPTSQS